MILSLQGKNNAKAFAEIERATGVAGVSSEAFAGKFNGHKFRPGQEVALIGLEDYPEFNGEIVTITRFRVDGAWGRAYYFRTDNPELESQLNWAYEYRLETLNERR